MKTLKEAKIKKGSSVLVRAGFDCPLGSKGEILDDYRIRTIVPTIRYLLEKEAKIILISHLDRPNPKSERDLKRYTLGSVALRLEKLLKRKVKFLNDCIGERVEREIRKMKPKEIVVLENLRFYKEEKENDLGFAKKLSELADIFVNDAFGVCHRSHCSIVGIPRFLPSYAGLWLEREIKVLTYVLKNAKRPLVGVFGGVKIKTKLPAIKRFLSLADYVLVGGKIARNINFSHPKLYLPSDFRENMDIGPRTINRFKGIILKGKTIVWNGPLGCFEKEEFAKGTKAIAEAISRNKGFKIAGGGETLLAILKYHLKKKFNFLSTGGGAMLMFLGNERLPGLEVLKD